MQKISSSLATGPAMPVTPTDSPTVANAETLSNKASTVETEPVPRKEYTIQAVVISMPVKASTTTAKDL